MRPVRMSELVRGMNKAKCRNAKYVTSYIVGEVTRLNPVH